MRNILRFIKLNHFLLLFLIIESFSIYLLISENKFQEYQIIQYTNEYTSKIHNYTNKISHYINLKETNDHLSKENAKLYSILNTQNLNNNYSEDNIKHSYIAAKVIRSSINKRNNYITLNKGRKDGVEKGMGVITQNGIIGIIYSVSENYSIVISFLHRESAIGIKIKRNNHNGILRWQGFNYRQGNISNLPNHILIKKGDSIVTNSHSIIFPESIPIGEITNFEKKETGYYDVNVKLFEDFNNLYFVYIVNRNKSKEQELLEIQIDDK